jgi:L-ascorbate metabolism protein UlaG (beta-lactamase superfamily)
MKIKWLGHASFLIETSGVRIVTDPYSEIGLKFPKVEADIVTVSHDHFDHNAVNNVGGKFEVVRGVKETTLKGVKFTGVASYHDEVKGTKRGNNTIFVIEAEGLKVVHLGDIGHTIDKNLATKIGGVDVLMVPVGGVYTVDSQGAANIVETLSPKIVVPMHYKISGLSLSIADEKPFITKFKNVERKKELEVVKANLPSQLTVVLIEPLRS